ncbi:MAG TPA: hypothetical protein DDW65_13335 [Firmicutes bacterium]|jgi:hypothetical protein|nr:hypothetical protein [Bacillota bacterium]
MRKIYVYLCLACITILISAEVLGNETDFKLPTLVKQGKDIHSFIPPGWKLIKNTQGDLNKDGLADIAGILESKAPPKDLAEAPPRILFIAFRENQQYRLSFQTEKAILTADMGGVWGDPLESISVDHGSLLINFYGGSNERWFQSYRFRYQGNGWYLIGATLGSYFTPTGAGQTEDYNLLTGMMIITTTDKNGNEQAKNIHRGKKPLVNLQDFDIALAENQL